MVLVLFLLVGMTSVFAQKHVSVSGRITDELNEPMIGVSVLEKGTTNGVITDLDGNYTLSVNEGATIVFSYIGYVTQEKKAAAGTMNIVLKEDNKTLDEVVVVGYGVQKKSSVTGAISSVKAEDFENRTITNAEQALQGKTAGVQIISASAAPGSNPAIRIRGYSSNASSDPLYVVDGLRTKDISNLDPNDIESMEVLKDAASAAIYGAQAGNGFVLITTRKAKKGVRRISYDFQLSSQSLGRTPDILNAQEYVNYMTEGNLIPRETIDRYWDGKTNTDWVKETFESSMMQRHNVNFQGANDNGSLFASLSYLSNNGPIVGNKDVFVFVYQRCGSYGCRNVSSDDYGLFLLHLGIYGLYHCGSQSPGQKYYTDVHCHHGILRIPCDLGLYGICVFSYDSVPVPAVYVFLEHYRSGGDLVFHTDIQTKNGSPVVRQRSHFSVSTRSRPARWCMDLCSFGLCSSRNGSVTNRQEMSAFQCHINGRK